MNGVCNSNFFLAPPPGALGNGQKVKYRLISKTKSISKIFKNFVCVLTNKSYKTYQKAFSFCHLGHVPGVGLRGRWGCPGVNKRYIFFKYGHVANQIDANDKQNGMQVKFSS